MRYLIFNSISKVITGWQESPSLSGSGIVEDADRSLWNAREAHIANGALRSAIIYDNGAVVLLPETRHTLDVNIVTDQPIGPNGEDIIIADGLSEATLTINLFKPNGDPSNFTGDHLITVFDDKIALVSFTSGQAVKKFRTKISRKYVMGTSENYILTGERIITAISED